MLLIIEYLESFVSVKYFDLKFEDVKSCFHLKYL